MVTKTQGWKDFIYRYGHVVKLISSVCRSGGRITARTVLFRQKLDRDKYEKAHPSGIYIIDNWCADCLCPT